VLIKRGDYALVMFLVLTAAWTTRAPAQDHKAGHGWGYDGDEGPSHWGDLKPEFAPCKNGHRQSPVDISNTQKADLPTLQFDYTQSPLHIIDNGHTIMINYGPGSSLRVGDKQYQLKQFHFHELWNDLPKEREKEEVLENVQIDLTKLLPADRGYYTFSGSLTTPPCSEDVTWFVLKHPVTVTAAEIEQFGKLYRNDARPTQPLYGRVVLESK
jgi:carbonic anhydrase